MITLNNNKYMTLDFEFWMYIWYFQVCSEKLILNSK